MARKKSPSPRRVDNEKAFFFRLVADREGAEDAGAALSTLADRMENGTMNVLDFEHEHAQYQFCEPHWDNSDEARVFSGSILKHGTEPLPPAVEKGAAPEPLSLAPAKGLGETMCFAYEPSQGVALVLYSHRGPKHSVLPVFFREAGAPHVMRCSPICWDDVMARLERMGFVVSFSIGIKDLANSEELMRVGESLESMIELGKSMGGKSVSLHVKIDTDRGGFAVKPLTRLIRRIQEIGTTKLSKLQMKAAETDGDAIQVLDFIKARIQTEIEVPRQGRAVDRVQCQKLLVRSLKDYLPVIQEQKRS